MTTPPHLPAAPSAASAEEVVLRPRFWVPLGVLVLAAAGLALRPLLERSPSGRPWSQACWGCSCCCRRRCCVCASRRRPCWCARRDTVIRRFPYDAWIGWRVWWPALPVLFYFREERSIHLLPMLFDATALREQLERRLHRLPAPRAPDLKSSAASMPLLP